MIARDSGQATVEFALLVPLLAALALVLVQVALVLGDQLALTQAAREAVRAASVDPDPDRARAAAHAVLPGVTVHTGARPGVGEPVRVEVRYRSRTAVPLVGALLPDPVLSARAVMRVEQ